ncbi:WXG100 family type VII secretion target [Streptomyces sp. NPDC059080]|uniref:WXG100 family type VII secretion target n=1 Tax=Streptomyces sp. NPDC059080 TaxID=3346718 RepID=UPI0036A059B8
MQQGGHTTSGFKVTPEMIAQAASSCDNTAADVETKLQNLKAYVISLEQSWQGIAHNTFQIYMAEYDTYAQMLHNALTDIASGLRGNEVNYKESEQDNLNRIRALQAELPTARLS